jgi:hypothetical protein
MGVWGFGVESGVWDLALAWIPGVFLLVTYVQIVPKRTHRLRSTDLRVRAGLRGSIKSFNYLYYQIVLPSFILNEQSKNPSIGP